MAATLLFSACRENKEWTIHGTFDIPDTIQYGDTFLVTPSLDGMRIYLVSLSGDDCLDSTVVADGSFTFSGTVEEPRMCYVACEFSIGTIVLEPGTINVIMSETFEATGTPNNDGITALEGRMAEFNETIRGKLLELQANAEALTPEGQDSVRMLMYGVMVEYGELVNQMIDSTAEAHPDDFVGVYAWNLRLNSADDSETLDSMLVSASDFVRNSEAVSVRRAYLSGLLMDEDFYPEDFGLEGDGEPEGPEGPEGPKESDGPEGPRGSAFYDDDFWAEPVR